MHASCNVIGRKFTQIYERLVGFTWEMNLSENQQSHMRTIYISWLGKKCWEIMVNKKVNFCWEHWIGVTKTFVSQSPWTPLNLPDTSMSYMSFQYLQSMHDLSYIYNFSTALYNFSLIFKSSKMLHCIGTI